MPKVVRVGLDIGSSAVRAAEVAAGDGGSEVRRFGQVGLPAGAVVEGEVRDQVAVSDAIRRLWAEGGFSRRDVVVGIGSQRAMVRPLEMSPMSGSELRSALRYEISELLPIPIEQAVFDFSILGPGQPKSDGTPTMRVLAVIAQRDIVWDVIHAVQKAGLKTKAVDSSPLAMLRAVPPVDAGLEAVVSLGAQLVVVAVREGSTPRFVRTVTIGGETTAHVGGEVSVGGGAAPGSRFPSAGGVGPDGASKLVSVAEEVRGSLEFFLSHGQDEHLSIISLTGGGALSAEAGGRISASVAVPVQPARVVASYSASALGLSEEQLHEAEMRWATAVGLALWGVDGASAPSLLPSEIKERARRNQVIVAAGLGVVLVAGGLGVLSHSRDSHVASVKSQIAAEQTESNGLSAEAAKLEAKALPVQEVKSLDQLGTTLLASDIDWVKLDNEVEAAAPIGVHFTTVTFTAQAASAGSASDTAVPVATGAEGVVGSIALSGTAIGGPPQVAEFLRRLHKVQGLSSIWMSTVTQAGGSWTFESTANVTTKALGRRASTLPGVHS